MASVLTPLRGKAALSARWLGSYKQASLSDRPIIAVNNDADNALVAELKPTILQVQAYGGHAELERVNHIARIYGELIKAAKSEWVILWDDDILPPSDGVSKLLWAARKAAASIAGIVSIYPFTGDEGRAVLFFQPYGAASNFSNLPASGLHDVWGGGTGFSIWRRESLLESLPLNAIATDGTIYGWDRDLSIKMQKAERRIMVEASVRCRHDTLPE